MGKVILTINIGSSSKKYHLQKGDEKLLIANFEKKNDLFLVSYNTENEQVISQVEYEKSLNLLLKKIQGISKNIQVDAIGMRIVAPGTYFTQNRRIDDKFLKKIRLVETKDLIHIEPIEKEICLIRKVLPGIKIVAVSDSAFHANRPEVSTRYALPEKLAKENDIYRFGYHGISISNIINTLKQKSLLKKRMIVCHLGSGASVTALLNGKSIDTSMGYSPLEGLVMSSRIGNIDAEAVLRLSEQKRTEEMQKIFYSKSGLLAISELSADMRVLLEAEKKGNKKAHLAIELFLYSIKKYIGAYSAILGGIDALVFSGAIGERSEIIRARICKDLEYLNLKIAKRKNQNVTAFSEISSQKSHKIYVIHSDENTEIMRITSKNI